MSTTAKNTKLKTQNFKSTTSLSKIGNVLTESATANFDELYSQDDKEVDKKIAYHNKRKGKEVQLLSKVNHIQMCIAETQTSFRKSLVDPTKDSVRLALEIECLQKELTIAEGLLRQLFGKK